ncbi:hypothetical protein GPJ56_005308 [Histomonas meleagridis]|uniref:uncharacterized protein n=1 Tax=Histomonas meleagridis TaxID=135588 RepID=UPI003559BF03|nr:hypothetical protein GPJ56_005308 [Histomonas meleagridis]KAH0796288.1 hypothetical protein GO595_010181 [Histomonas meleagridis]
MSEEFTRHFFRYFIAKMAMNLSSGNEQEIAIASISENTLDILADVAIYYLTKLAREIRDIVELSGRTEPNGYDVFNVLRRYRESMNSLSSFIVDRGNTGEVVVKDYPIVSQARIFSPDVQQEGDLFPFRANSIIDYTDRSKSEFIPPHIPRFFPLPEDMDENLKNEWLRRSYDSEEIMEAVEEQSQTADLAPKLQADSPLVEEIIKSIFGDEAPQM